MVLHKQLAKQYRYILQLRPHLCTGLYAAALLFCVAIGSFATSKLVFVEELGLGTAAAVALDATIVRALLVPALMAILGEWNWWAPSPLRRLHARFHLGKA